MNMKPSGILSEKPRARALTVYYGVALSIICLSGIGVIATLVWREEGSVDFRVPLIGLVGGVCIFAFIGYIHLEMISAVYAITETSAHARWGILVKHDESVQLARCDPSKSVRDWFNACSSSATSSFTPPAATFSC